MKIKTNHSFLKKIHFLSMLSTLALSSTLCLEKSHAEGQETVLNDNAPYIVFSSCSNLIFNNLNNQYALNFTESSASMTLNQASPLSENFLEKNSLVSPPLLSPGMANPAFEGTLTMGSLNNNNNFAPQKILGLHEDSLELGNLKNNTNSSGCIVIDTGRLLTSKELMDRNSNQTILTQNTFINVPPITIEGTLDLEEGAHLEPGSQLSLGAHGCIDLHGTTQVVQNIIWEDGSALITAIGGITPSTPLFLLGASRLTLHLGTLENTQIHFENNGYTVAMPCLEFANGGKIINGTLLIDSSRGDGIIINQSAY